eukprot:scaffold19628_cov28-Tisochrysis_lutea.AAC.2
MTSRLRRLGFERSILNHTLMSSATGIGSEIPNSPCPVGAPATNLAADSPPPKCQTRGPIGSDAR